MRAKVQALIAEGRVCEARSENDILFVFPISSGCVLRLGHEIELDPLTLNIPQVARNLTTQQELSITLKDNNVHDLRLPSGHGTSRTPCQERLRGA
jgi:hypothetical protein